jgi:hypothetical protein
VGLDPVRANLRGDAGEEVVIGVDGDGDSVGLAPTLGAGVLGQTSGGGEVPISFRMWTSSTRTS